MKRTPATTLAFIAALSLTASALSGCSSTRTTSTVTREETTPPASSEGASANKPGTVVTEKTETGTESDSGIGCSGVISCTFHGLGWVIALPFRAVAGAIELIF